MTKRMEEDYMKLLIVALIGISLVVFVLLGCQPDEVEKIQRAQVPTGTGKLSWTMAVQFDTVNAFDDWIYGHDYGSGIRCPRIDVSLMYRSPAGVWNYVGSTLRSPLQIIYPVSNSQVHNSNSGGYLTVGRCQYDNGNSFRSLGPGHYFLDLWWNCENGYWSQVIWPPREFDIANGQTRGFSDGVIGPAFQKPYWTAVVAECNRSTLYYDSTQTLVNPWSSPQATMTW